MRSRKRIAILLAFTMLLTSVASYEFGKESDSSDARAASSSEKSKSAQDALADSLSGLDYDTDATLGTAENPFKVLEVVPYKGMGMLGYTVSGQEPVDISQFTSEQKQLAFATSSDTSGMLKYSSTLKKKSELSDTDDPDAWDFKKVNQTGYFEKVNKVGKGDYKLTITSDDVNSVPVYNFVNGTASNPSKVADNDVAAESDYTTATTSIKDNRAFYKNMIFKKSGTTGYTVMEDDYGTSEVIFKYSPGDTTATTYDAYVVQDMTDFYEAKQEEYSDGDAQCYEPSYTYDVANKCYVYDPSAETRFYVIFIKNPEGKGNYVISKTRDINDGSGSCINVPDCYYDMAKADYEELESDTTRYNVSAKYTKDQLTDEDDKLTEITSGNYDVTFAYNTSATGVKRYKAVVSNEINSYYQKLKDENKDKTISYEPTYVRHGSKYIALTDRSDTEGAYYVLFEEASDGEYIVSDAHEVIPSEDTPAFAMNMYDQSFGVSKSDTGRYKAKITNGTFTLDDKRGQYNFVEEVMPTGTKTDYLADKVWVKDYEFHFYTQGGYVSNNWFTKKILGLTDTEAKEYNVKIITATPSEINDDNSLIEKANLIYMSDNYEDGSTADRIYMWEHFGRDKSGSKDITKLDSSDKAVYASDSSIGSYLNFYAKDLSWDSTLCLFKRAAGVKNDFVPLVIDSTLYTETLKGDSGRYYSYASSKIKKVTPVKNPYSGDISSFWGGSANAFKLYVMLYTCESPLTFYNKYVSALDTTRDSYTFTVDASAQRWNSCYIHYWHTSSQGVGDKLLTPLGDYKFQGTVTTSEYSYDKINFMFMTNTNYNNKTNTCENYSEGSYNATIGNLNKTETTGNGKNKVTKYIYNISVTKNDEEAIATGRYKALSGDAAKFWNELTFLPKDVDTTSIDALNNISVDPYLAKIFVSRDSAKRVSGWPTINVKKNIFSFDATRVNNVYSELGDCMPEGSDTYIETAKNKVLELRGSLDKEPRPNWREIIYYLINVSMEDGYDVEINNKEELNILEIEPCKDFTLTEDEVRSWLPEYTGAINVTQWISTEYIGKINDVNEDFDIIYFGMNNSKLNKDFSDNRLDNKIYAHIGDKATTKKYNNHDWLVYNISGKMADSTPVSFSISSDEYRFSGNDISNLKLDELNNYVDGEYAVVLADKLYDKDTSVLDTSSNVYQFAKRNVSKGNVVKYSELSATSNKGSYGIVRERLQKYAGHTKLALDISASDDYIVESSKTSTYVSTSTMTLNYNYEIVDPYAKSTDKYTVTLYADTNGDGTYSDTEAIAIDTGRKAGTGGYTIERELTDDFSGILHWALVAQKQGSSDADIQRTDTKEGYLLINNAKAEKQTINILQINHSREKGELNASGTLSYGNNRYSTLHLNTTNLGRKETTNSTFKTLISNSEVSKFYNIQVTEITSLDFDNMYDKNETSIFGKKGAKYVKGDDKTDQLDKYDMIIYGFADAISDISNENGAFDNIMKFIDDGKAFLTTHDTTSMYNFSGLALSDRGIESNQYICGANSNQFIRDRVGMNRYNIRTLYQLENGLTKVSDAYDTAWIPGDNQNSKFDSNAGANVGFTDFLLLQAGNGTSKLMYKAGNRGYDNANNIATNVNQGQITRFPYDIDETIPTAITHGQYYQLNMDDPNIVVWYCLGGRDDETGKIYDVSRNDARNFYYIYSYKNIFYTGVGHSNVNGSMELKLFVNTMIAAFRASVKAPELIVNNEESSFVDPDSNVNQSILYYYTDLGSDEEETDYNFGSKLFDVKITPKDHNLISDKITLQFFDQNGNNITSSSEVYLVADNGDTSTKASITSDGVQVRSNYVYIYKFPMKLLQNSSDGTYTITTVIKNAVGKEATKQITIGKRTLFELK